MHKHAEKRWWNGFISGPPSLCSLIIRASTQASTWPDFIHLPIVRSDVSAAQWGGWRPSQETLVCQNNCFGENSEGQNDACLFLHSFKKSVHFPVYFVYTSTPCMFQYTEHSPSGSSSYFKAPEIFWNLQKTLKSTFWIEMTVFIIVICSCEEDYHPYSLCKTWSKGASEKAPRVWAWQDVQFTGCNYSSFNKQLSWVF